MIRSKWFLLFVGILIQSISLIGQDDWKIYEDPKGRFKISTPNILELKEHELKTELGILTTDSYIYDAGKETDNFLYTINISNYPDGTFPSDSTDLIEDFLSETILSIKESVSGEIKYTAPLDSPRLGLGKVYRVAYDEGYVIIKGKVFLKNNQFISLQVFTTLKKALNPSIDEFLDTFELIE